MPACWRPSARFAARLGAFERISTVHNSVIAAAALHVGDGLRFGGVLIISAVVSAHEKMNPKTSRTMH